MFCPKKKVKKIKLLNARLKRFFETSWYPRFFETNNFCKLYYLKKFIIQKKVKDCSSPSLETFFANFLASRIFYY